MKVSIPSIGISANQDSGEEVHMTLMDTSAAEEVLHTTMAKLLQAKVNVDVVIPALNEESLLKALLNEVTTARLYDWFQI